MNEDYTQSEKKSMLIFVRQTIEANIEKKASPNLVGAQFDEIRSCFVTLHNPDGSLRGCIGNIGGFEPLCDNLKSNALNAAFNDPRFQSVSTMQELADLHIEISVLTQAEDIPNPESFIVGEHGIILLSNGRSAVFLPQVATEQGWNRQTTLNNLSLKASLPQNAWEDPKTKFKIFKAIVFAEKK